MLMVRTMLLDRSERIALLGLMDPRPLPRVGRIPVVSEKAMVAKLARAATNGFASVNYPGAAHAQVLNSHGTTRVAQFVSDPSASPYRAPAFTFAAGKYE